jgi:UDP-N-acetylglucosamine--N-acetylmuramyl-(pentapeptide) pyrophosphoryl-undecaprenol N-acetylglucosamine transferase
MAGVVQLVRGVVESASLLKRHGVQAILATGGYVSAPVVLGGWLAKIPSLVFLPDVEPGLAVQFLSRIARRVAVTSDDSSRFFPRHKVVATGYPLRPELFESSRHGARQEWGIADHEVVLLIIGGSRGAHSINAAVAAVLPSFLREAVVFHACGPEDQPWLSAIAEALPNELRSRYHLAPYFHKELGPAMAAADLAISRAGASVMGEYPYFGLPSIMIPYPYAGAHQQNNADFLVSRGAGLRLADEDLGRDILLPTVLDLLNDRARLKNMSDSARALAHPEAAQAIARELLRLCSNT